jgi:hypothetical protein
MTLHDYDLAWAFTAAIVVSCTFALVVISMLLSRVRKESRDSEKDEYNLNLFLENANIVIHEYYAKQRPGNDGPYK